ncbi:hypothetical protein Cantr_08371 [Candida viswanathii]|uniref:Uncharacterized protein n=1 Tax=Candida viswanathii TaxID=5486 RepID=A0A367Y497_9ASCO|nr:hypothetical protein Cantr_08371 [Candida viswanathii]
MVNLFNNYSSPYDDLVNHFSSSVQGQQQQQQRGGRRGAGNNPNVTVKEVKKPDHHEIQIHNRTGYRNFKIEVVKQGLEYFLLVQSPGDRFEKFFKLNPASDDLQNVKSQVVDDWLIISIPMNKQQHAKSNKRQAHTPKKQTKNETPTKSTPSKSSNSRTKSPPPPSSASSHGFSKAKSSTKNFFSRNKKLQEPPSLLEAARRRPFLEEVPDPGI